MKQPMTMDELHTIRVTLTSALDSFYRSSQTSYDHEVGIVKTTFFLSGSLNGVKLVSFLYTTGRFRCLVKYNEGTVTHHDYELEGQSLPQHCVKLLITILQEASFRIYSLHHSPNNLAHTLDKSK